jgi:membrane fusion protein (multidrug efflux system)
MLHPRYRTPPAGRRLLLVAAGATLLAGCGGGKDDKEAKGPSGPPEAGFVVLKTETVPLVSELAGRTAAYETSDVRPQVSGVIKARLFSEGSIVRAGQTLYQIDPSLYQAAAAEARANLASAQATREAAQARARRYKPLAQMEAVSRQDADDANATAREAEAAVAQNRAQLDTAEINIRFTRVPAPITGRIGRSIATTGALVTSGQTEPLTTIQRLDPIFVDIQQSSAELLALRRALASGGVIPSSTAVELVLEDGSTYPARGTVQFSEAMVDPATGTVTLRATFANPNGLLLPGMYVRAKLSQATQQNGILVPQQGVSRDPKGNSTVFLVGPGNKAVRTTVVATRTIGDKWLVTSGLKPGDRVIVEGLGKVKPNQVVRPVPAGSAAARRPGGAAGASAVQPQH